MLGHSHTRPGGNKPGWAPSATRMRWAVHLLDRNDVAILGRDVPTHGDDDPAREALIGEVEALGAAFDAAVDEDQATD